MVDTLIDVLDIRNDHQKSPDFLFPTYCKVISSVMNIFIIVRTFACLFEIHTILG